MAQVKRILSLDGGGIRGVIPARILMEIEKMTGKPIAETFDYIAGTSTGGIITLCLAKPDDDGKPAFSAEQILQLYKARGGQIFSSSLWHKIKNIGNVAGPKYGPDGIEKVLKDYLGKTMLSDSLVKVLVPAYSIDHRGPRFFKSWDEDDQLMWKVARATSAAPTYFPPYTLTSGKYPCTLVDGGVFANTPAMCVFADATRLEERGTVFKVMSIGTGEGGGTLNPKCAKNWGLVGWIQPLLEILLNSSSCTSDYQMKHLLDPTDHEYLRLQVTIPGGDPALDDVSIIDDMVKLAESMLHDRRQDIVDFFEDHQE